MEWDWHYFPFALTNPRASVSDVLRMAPRRLGRRTRWFQALVSFVNFVSAGGGVMRPRWVCGVRNDRGAALSHVRIVSRCAWESNDSRLA